MTKIYTETPAFGAEGYLIYDFFDKVMLFRVENKDGTFINYRLTHPDLTVKIIDKYAAFYEIDGQHYLDVSGEGMEPNE